MPIEDFKRIVESLRLAVAIADAKGDIVFANASLVQMLGKPAKGLAGTPLAGLFAAGDQKRVQQNVERVASGKAGSSFVDGALAGKGKAPGMWVQAALQPALDAKDKPAGVIAVLQDIGPQRETEEALNLLTARLLSLTDTVPAALMIETAPGDVELVNDAFCRLLAIDSAAQSLSGLEVGEVLKRSPLVNPKTLGRIGKNPTEAASVEVKLADGSIVMLERHPIMVEGEHAGAVWAPRDEGIAGGTRPMVAKGAAGVALVEKIGEELSVALEGLSAVSIRAQQLDVDPALVDHLRNIRSSTESAMAAIGDLVDFSLLSGGVVLHKAPFGLRAALADLIARLVPEAEEHGCQLRIKVEQDVIDSLEGDVARLHLVLRNLLVNAFTLAPGSKVTLQITPEYTTESGIQLSFAVATSADAAQISAEAGMGVAVARFMVAAMGGDIVVGGEPREPLYAFTIEFPVRPPAPVPRRPTYVSLVGLTALVVSADAEQRLTISSLLRGWRMVPLEADNAAMALALLERMHQEGTPVPVALVSNRLPVQDGFLLAFRIHHHPKLAPTLVMMLATEGRPGDAIACRENGVAAYMRYPINDRQLNEAIMAVTGASVDADEAPTLVTRHSLREQRRGMTLLLVDPSRDSQILAAHVLGRHDCSVVVAHDLAEAAAALDQDFYDVVVVDTSLAGLGGADAPGVLRSHIAKNADQVHLVAASLEHSPAYRKAKIAAGFDGTIAKPFRREDLLVLARTQREST